MIMYPMRLVPLDLGEREPDDNAAERIQACLGGIVGLEHLRVLVAPELIRLWAFLSAPDAVTALPIITTVRGRLTTSEPVPGWHLVPDQTFA
ncbi:MAG TPA: hypothetical protein PKK40_01120 [Marmoricola sp.]|nr:hypothetical protein [Marmoricola sp.]